MFNNYFKTGYIAFFLMLVFIVLSMCIFTPIFSLNSNYSLVAGNNKFYSVFSEYAWPLPSSSKITSTFGFRINPTQGASSFHSGIDIAAPEGSDIIACLSGIVIYTNFYGSAGCTVMIKSENIVTLYCHVYPTYLVYVGQNVIKGEVIAKVGPKNIYTIPNNPYKDSLGNPTNGATTGPHLHFAIKKDGIAVNPLNYVSYSSSS